MSTRVLVPSALAALVCACGTKYIADLDPQQLASSEDGDENADDNGDDQGQTVTSGAETGGESSTGDGSTGEPVECEPDPNAVCGPEPEETIASFPPASPVSGGDLPLVTEYDCTVTELEFIDETNSHIVLDCGLEFPTDVSHALPQVTFDKLNVGAAVHVLFAISTDGNGASFTLSLDDHPISISMNGTSVDPNPGTAVFAPFTVTAQEDLCLAPCDVGDRCYSQDRQKLDFAVDGEDVASLWASSNTTIMQGDFQYEIEVGLAYGAEKVNPDSYYCMLPGYAAYAFRIMDVTP